MRTIASNIVLTAALRSNLLSLQSTQRLVDTTQLRLATGLEVNSTLDNPQNFFAARRLDNRASDLNSLLDGISQSIRTIEVADNGISSLGNLVEQADSIVQLARDELDAFESTARAIGNIDLSTITDLTALASIDNGDQFQIITTDISGLQISETITFVIGDSANTLTEKITNQFSDNQNSEISATITNEGFISIESFDGRTFRIVDGDVGSANEVSNAGFDSLGLGNYFELEFTTVGGPLATRAAATIIAGNTINSISLYESTGNLAEAGDTLAGATFLDAGGNTVISGFAPGSIFFLRARGEGGVAFPTITITATTTFQDIVDRFNQDTTLSQFISSSFDSSTGQLSFTSLSDRVDSLEVGAFAFGNSTFNIGLGDPTGNLDIPALGGGLFTLESRVFSFNQGRDTLDNLAADYNSVREQIDQIVNDANYRGINLLNNDNLTTFFNENSTSSLVTAGTNFTASGLGLTEASFQSSSQIEKTAIQTRSALKSVRSFGLTLANNLSIIQTRRIFTQNTINTITAGADDLTSADQNKEGANLLALQTRQTLGITSLSLAAQSQQSVLRLF